MNRKSIVTGLLALPPVAFLAIFFVYPLASILSESLGEGSGGLDVLRRPAIGRVLWFTVWQALASTVLTVVLALPLTAAIARYHFRGRTFLRAVLIVPFVLPTVVVASAFVSLSDALGIDFDRSLFAILAAHVFFNVAVVVRMVGGFWEQLDPAVEEAARVLGASRLRVFLTLTLRRLAPALFSAAAIVGLFTFTSFGVILILGGPTRATIETEIWRYATQRLELDVAASLALAQLVAVAGALVVGQLLAARGDTAGPVGSERTRLRVPVAPGERVVVAGGVASAVVLLGAPIAALIERSLRSGDGYSLRAYRQLFAGNSRLPGTVTTTVDAVGNSLLIAAVATLIATTLGLLAAVAIQQARQRSGRLLDLVAVLPLGASAVTLGFGYLIALDEGVLDLRRSWVIVPIAHALVGLPFVLRSVAPILRGIDDGVREAAAVLGASPTRVWREIDLALALRGLVIGAGFACAVSLGEFGATSFIARPDNPTVPVAIFGLLGRPGATAFSQAMALSVVLMFITSAVVLASERVRVGRSTIL